MATLLNSLTIPLSSPITCRRSPEFRPLRIRSSVPVSPSLRSVSRGLSPRVSRLRVSGDSQNIAAEVPEVTDDSWQSLVLDSASPVLVEFWAPWCGPCRMIHPIIDQLAKEYTGKLNCYKVNTDNSPSIASRYGVRSVPTVIIFKNGEKKDAVIGAVPKPTLVASIDKFL